MDLDPSINFGASARAAGVRNKPVVEWDLVDILSEVIHNALIHGLGADVVFTWIGNQLTVRNKGSITQHQCCNVGTTPSASGGHGITDVVLNLFRLSGTTMTANATLTKHSITIRSNNGQFTPFRESGGVVGWNTAHGINDDFTEVIIQDINEADLEKAKKRFICYLPYTADDVVFKDQKVGTVYRRLDREAPALFFNGRFLPTTERGIGDQAFLLAYDITTPRIPREKTRPTNWSTLMNRFYRKRADQELGDDNRVGLALAPILDPAGDPTWHEMKLRPILCALRAANTRWKDLYVVAKEKQRKLKKLMTDQRQLQHEQRQLEESSSSDLDAANDSSNVRSLLVNNRSKLARLGPLILAAKNEVNTHPMPPQLHWTFQEVEVGAHPDKKILVIRYPTMSIKEIKLAAPDAKPLLPAPVQAVRDLLTSKMSRLTDNVTFQVDPNGRVPSIFNGNTLILKSAPGADNQQLALIAATALAGREAHRRGVRPDQILAAELLCIPPPGSAPASAFEVKNVLLVIDEWGTSTGGIAAVNLQLARDLAKLPAVKIYCVITTITSEMRKNPDLMTALEEKARGDNVTLVWATEHKGEIVDVPNCPPVALIIGHAPFTSRLAIKLKKSPGFASAKVRLLLPHLSELI